jgi:hypothetical protein
MITFKKASDIECIETSKMTHEEFVNWDAGRIFSNMVQRACHPAVNAVHFVLLNPDDMERLPPCPGVYVAFSESGRCMYVGESCCVGKRLGSFHLKGSKHTGPERGELSGSKYVAFVPVNDMRERLRTEAYLIAILNPQNSGQLNRDYLGGVIATWGTVTWDAMLRAWSVNGSSTAIKRNGKVVRT